MKRWNYPEGSILLGDCYRHMSEMEDNSVDLVFGSPPYEDQREYEDLKFDLEGEMWVSWMLEICLEALRVSKGLVAFVIEGKTRKFRYSCSPILLAADLHRRGIHLKKPCIFARTGVPGNYYPDWFRNDYEFIIAFSKGGRLPWSDTVACGEPCKHAPGGKMSYRLKTGERVNAKRSWAAMVKKYMEETGSSYMKAIMDLGLESKSGWLKDKKGRKIPKNYIPPEKANPGNIVWCTTGGGRMGSNITHENEAGFPEKVADRFVRSFCPPGGIVYDPFGGSGTTLSVAIKTGRRFLASDVRPSQIELMKRRVRQARALKGFGT